MAQETVLIAYGGPSYEHDVSLVSAEFVSNHLQEAGYHVVPVYVDTQGNWHLQTIVDAHPKNQDLAEFPEQVCLTPGGALVQRAKEKEIATIDAAFPVIHGTLGEDGSLQGHFETMQLPYAGANVASSALAMDKALARAVFTAHSIPQTKHITIDRNDWEYNRNAIGDYIGAIFTFPVFAKPASGGSTIGVSKADDFDALEEAITTSLAYDDHILIEQAVEGRELEIALTGNYPHYEVTQAGEIVTQSGFYDYDTKYQNVENAELRIPTEINDTLLHSMQSLAKRAFSAIRGDGFARIDFFYETAQERLLVNEINTLPGFTPNSMFPLLWDHEGLHGANLMQRLIALGKERHRHRVRYRP